MKFNFQTKLTIAFISLLIAICFLSSRAIYFVSLVSQNKQLLDLGTKIVDAKGVDITVNVINQLHRDMAQRTVTTFIIGVVLSIIMGYIISRHFARPIQKLADAANIISKGNLSYRIEEITSDEIGFLTHAFNEMAAKLESSYNDLKLYFIETIQSLAHALEAKDHYTSGHSERVTKYATLIAQEMKLSPTQVDFINRIGLLHDIGKIGISESILTKKEPLTEKDWEEIKKHPAIGVGILNDIDLLKPALSIIKSHHERPDGKGYPDGLILEEIPLLASVISVADAFDAMCSERPYRRALSIDEAKQELKEFRGTQFHTDVVDVLLKLIEEGRMKENKIKGDNKK